MRRYAHEYIAQVRDTKDPRIVMPGAIYGQGYRELGSHCFAYIHATEVGGTHPALIEAMGRGALVLYRDTPENAKSAATPGCLSTMKWVWPLECERPSRCRRKTARTTVEWRRSACASVTTGPWLHQI